MIRTRLTIYGDTLLLIVGWEEKRKGTERCIRHANISVIWKIQN